MSIKEVLTRILETLKPMKTDYIVEEGTSGIWTYRKWKSGVAECWGTASSSSLTWSSYMASPSANPYLYVSNSWSVSLPFTMIDTSYKFNANVVVGTHFGWVARFSKTTSAVSFQIVRNGNTGSATADIMIVGSWDTTDFDPSSSLPSANGEAF